MVIDMKQVRMSSSGILVSSLSTENHLLLLSELLKEESNTEETFAISANSGKFAKV